VDFSIKHIYVFELNEPENAPDLFFYEIANVKFIKDRLEKISKRMSG